jgi:starvation-inducible DNA-binding protein
MKPNIGISDKNMQQVASLLSSVLADAVVLYTKTRKFHWNVNGESFMEIHKLFEDHYKQLEEAIDEVAERISKLGSSVIGTMKEFLGAASLKESVGKYPARMEMIKELLNDHETVIKAIRKGIDDCDKKYSDAGTADFLTGLMEQHETIAWTLRRYLN